MNLLYFKITTGEEIIAKANKIPGGWYIEDPALLIQLEGYKVGLASWIPYTTISTGVNLPDKAILFFVDVAPDMMEYYMKWVDPESEYVELQNPEDKEKDVSGTV